MVLLVAVAAIIVGVVLAALGQVGEMAPAPADVAPVDVGTVSAADIAMLRPPMALWGYNMQATDDALQVIAQSVTERDVEIASLRNQLAQVCKPQASEPLAPDSAQPPFASDRADWPAGGVSGVDG